MIEYYPEIRLVHVGAVLTSGAVFFLRGLALLSGARWPLSSAMRFLSYSIDSVLLTAALMLSTILRQYPFVHGWLTTKVVLLVVYIGVGIMAFRSPSPKRRLPLWLTALAIYAFIYSVARAHHPLGIFATLLR